MEIKQYITKWWMTEDLQQSVEVNKNEDIVC